MKPILMNPADTLSQMVSSQSNGLGRLNAISCIVTEERNGMYEAELSVFIDDEHFGLLSVGSVLKIMTNEGMQLFRVYQITKPMNGICTVFAHHITYDLNKAPVLPFTATGASNSLNGLVSHLVTTYPFSVFTDITSSSKFTLQEPQYFRECLGGYQGSILDVFGGEYKWDNLTVRLLAHRGSDSGVQIRYGKNMIDVEQETNIENMYTAVLGYATVDDVTTTGTLQTIVPGSAPKTLIVDFSDEIEEGVTVTSTVIDNLARQYIQSHNLNKPNVNISVSFVTLAQTDQYKEIAPLEHVKLCDTVHVFFEKLGIEASAKVIKTEYDSLNERLTSVEVGDSKSTMMDVIDDTVSSAENEQKKVTNAIDGAIQNLTNMILNSLGLFVTKVQKSGGGYQYYMHNRPVLADSQYQWTINAGGFAVSQNYGATWSAGIDAQGNAVFNSIAANVVNAMDINGTTITGGQISGATISAGGNNNVNGSIQVKNSSGSVIGKWDKDGLNISSGTITGGTISGATINSGEMYWYKGTAKEASLKEGQFSIIRGQSTVVYDKAVIMSADAYKINSKNAIILYVNSGGEPRIIIDDESAVVRAGTGNVGGYIEATQTALKIGATVYGQSSFSTYTVNWRQVNGVWVLAAQ
jgi:phage minor structural protein